MSLRVLTGFESHDLVELATLKDELGITASTDDTTLSRLITRASGILRDAIGYDLVRQKYRETHGGSRTGHLLLARSPVVGTPTVTDLDDPDLPDGAGDAVTDFVVADYPGGILYRQNGWGPHAMISRGLIEPTGLVGSESPRWRIDYWAGWIPPGFATTGDGISADASDDSFSDADAGFPTFLQAGDEIDVSGFSAAANNKRWRVLTATSSKITVEGDVTTEAAVSGTDRTIEPRSLPADLEDATLMLAKSLWLSRGRDRSVESEKVGPFSVKYASFSDRAAFLPSDVQGVVARYERVA